jgi:hypothetical protein
LMRCASSLPTELGRGSAAVPLLRLGVFVAGGSHGQRVAESQSCTTWYHIVGLVDTQNNPLAPWTRRITPCTARKRQETGEE